MQRAFELAQMGQGHVAPNPMVGAVLVYNNTIIGEGYHQKYGSNHAEINAIESVKEKELISKSTLYVNLEPCSHYGHTPPCAEAIVNCNIPKVVISNTDPSEKVKGKGVDILKKNHIEVITDVLFDAGAWLNRRFFTFHTKQRPYIILKWAQTQNGFINAVDKGVSKPLNISNEHLYTLSHKWRAEEQSILVGTNTAIIDKPSLTVRKWHGKNPLRIILDKDLKVNRHNTVFTDKNKTWIFHNRKITPPSLDELRTFIGVDCDPQISLADVLDELYRQKVLSVIVEGGAQVLNSFLQEGLWDEARVITSTVFTEEGIAAPNLTRAHLKSVKQIGNNSLHTFVHK